MRCRVRIAFTITLLLLYVVSFAQTVQHKPLVCYFTNKQQKIPFGGHLQGIQSYTQHNRKHFIITASSGSYSYYVTAGVDSDLQLVKIVDAPFRHAGGCQIADDKLFVGVEDNVAKDKSKVEMISPSDKTIVTVVERSGTYKRSTAGAVGAVKTNGHYLVAVGDWDSRNIDFYQSSANGFDSVGTYHAPDSIGWGSYQSINLLADSSGEKIYLLGFFRQGNKNRCDLFSVDNFKLIHKLSADFKCVKGCSFRYGAGIEQTCEHEVTLYACQRQIKKRNAVNVFRFWVE